jgi:hypothetical protein
MTLTLKLAFLILALVCFFLSAVGVSTNKVNLQSLGLFLLTCYFLVP